VIAAEKEKDELRAIIRNLEEKLKGIPIKNPMLAGHIFAI
jgi:hypothetical protein